MTAMAGWGLAGSVLSLETLQRALALDNRARDLLVGSALSAGLVLSLLAKLDWRDAAGAGASSSVRLSCAMHACWLYQILCVCGSFYNVLVFFWRPGLEGRDPIWLATKEGRGGGGGGGVSG